jgi:F0F1-type ATP synthase membrane subunit c/vacuolar-type H+-ATPase subunit K
VSGGAVGCAWFFIVSGRKIAGCSVARTPDMPGRATPTMVIGVAFTTTVRPTTPGSAAKRRRQ